MTRRQFRFGSRVGNDSTKIMRPDMAHRGRPDDTHIMSRKRDGSVLSYYGSDVWDFRAYRPGGYAGNVRINFNSIDKNMIADAKWLIFMIIYHSSGNRIKPSTLSTYFKGIRSLSRFAIKTHQTLIGVISKERLLVSYLRTKPAKSTLCSVKAIQYHLMNIGSEISGICGVNQRLISLTSLANHKAGNYKQYPVIPNRLLQNLIDDLEEFFRIWASKESELYAFITDMANSRCYARQIGTQKKHGRSQPYLPTFGEAIRIHNLEDFASRFGLEKSRDISGFINKTQHAIQTIVSIFTGMRRGEVQKLNKGSLSDERDQEGPILVNGITSKLDSQDEKAQWISCSKIIVPMRIAEKLSDIIISSAKAPLVGRPLFPGVSYLGFACAKPKLGSETKINVGNTKSAEIFQLFDENNYKVTKADLAFLDCIDPLRAWDQEQAFQIGSVWRFTNHQYRRSLAYYVAQSGLVSLPELKFQLKHITKEMTLYYTKFFSSKNVNSEYLNEFHCFVMETKPEADTVAFLNNISQSKEPLFGVKAKKIDIPSDLLFGQDRDALLNSFKKGEIAYSVTPLGACTTNQTCHKRAMTEVSACINCSSAIIKKSNLDRVISRQKHLVSQCNRNQTDNFEYRVELAELEALEKYKSRIIKKEST